VDFTARNFNMLVISIEAGARCQTIFNESKIKAT